MIRVFVETNFLIDVLRPFPSKGATNLLDRHNVDIKIYLPWCCAAEAMRTLERITREDLAFVDGAGKFFGRVMNPEDPNKKPTTEFARHAQEFIKMARKARAEALYDYPDRIDRLVKRLETITPSNEVVRRTIQLFPTKSLTPFDEMVLGAVLEQAYDLYQRGEREIYFCSLNKNDFRPTTDNGLGRAYSDAGLQYLDSFDLP